jgi:phage terminase large subunit
MNQKLQIHLKMNRPKVINEVYLPYLEDYTRRYEVYFGSAGSGKSVFVVQKLILKYLRYPNRRGLIVRKVANTIRNSVWQLFKDVLSDWNILHLCTVRESYFNIVLPNGSQFIFVGLDDVEKVKSITRISDIFIEEATELEEKEYDQLNLRMRADTDYNQLIIAYNPVSPTNWVYARFHKGNVDTNTTLVLKTTFKDNRFLDEQYILAIKSYEHTNPVMWAIYGLGEFCGGERVAFPEFNRDLHVCVPFKIPANWVKWISIDNGYTDPFAVYWYALSEDGTVYVYRQYTRLHNEEKIYYSDQAKGIVTRSMGENIITNVVGHDAYNVNNQGAGKGEGKSLISYYNQGGLYNFTKANTNRILGKTTVHEYLKPVWDEEEQMFKSKLQIFDTCTQLIETLPNLLTDEKNAEKVEDSAIDHWYDSLRYGLIYSHAAKSSGIRQEQSHKLIDELKKSGLKKSAYSARK